MKKEILGVIGGLGPIATAHFMELVINMTQANSDQENVEMIIYNFPSIPDRTDYILGKSDESPLPEMLRIGQALSSQGVSLIAIPCVTAHYFYREIAQGIPAPVVNGIAETIALLKARGIQKVGIMATDGTIQTGLLSRELESAGMEAIVPSAQGQQDVMHLIYKNVKAGKKAEMDRFCNVRQELKDKGAQVILLGCTELSLIKRDEQIGPGFLDIMEVLAQQSVLRCGKTLRAEYENLITG